MAVLSSGDKAGNSTETLYMMTHREVEDRGIGNMMVGCVDIRYHGSWFGRLEGVGHI